jgi:hypothetical protein
MFDRATYLAARFPPGRCVACGGATQLTSLRFRWRKLVGKTMHSYVRARHESRHPLCQTCLAQLRARRRRFWPVRYVGGFLLAASLCGLIACPMLLLFMRLNRAERTQVLVAMAAGAAALPVAWLLLRIADRLSVPGSLAAMAGDGWECVSVTETVPPAARTPNR